LTVICALGESALANILIVDDDPAVQAAVSIVLQRAGHSVVVAGDGRQGLAMFEAGDFDLLVLDIFMPGMDGLETMKLIHQQQPRIPILVISGRSMTSDLCTTPDFLKMATKLGAISSLPKPFGPAELLAAVAGCLEAARPPPAIGLVRRYCRPSGVRDRTRPQRSLRRAWRMAGKLRKGPACGHLTTRAAQSSRSGSGRRRSWHRASS
jgi:CheY-like chemotaxis protein